MSTLNGVGIGALLDAVAWEELPGAKHPQEPGDLPHATHRGVLTIGDVTLECFVLSSGERVFSEESVRTFFGLEPSAEDRQ